MDAMPPLLAVSPELRGTLIDALVTSGADLTRADAGLVVDLACHAVDECGRTLIRVARTAPNVPLQKMVATVAAMLLNTVTATPNEGEVQ